MKANTLAFCAAALLGGVAGWSAGTFPSSAAQTTIESPSQWRVTAEISAAPIVPADATTSGDFGYGPLRATDW